MVGAVSHAADSDDDFLNEIADDLRYLYQLKFKDLEETFGVELPNEAHCVVKHLLWSFDNDVEDFAKRKREGTECERLGNVIAKEGALIRKIIEHYEVEENEREETEEVQG